ncbi:TIGR01621 family pseudouridine synthase [Rodentibacter trehalosifermentans]|uniref:RNA pseudouridine synthase n=1 Tax=Rodentibacter trehalosifermentans TaxID=1908263 RepID=A0A1V3IYJ9_9PAST|nr:TIGR01621 family pseudouridine synthase [Rodentibacter trehalosifermentans]OOF47357.1 RNA pseudouridine synthase [Rodentibacter trehalosifermentans]OOF49073.1 RNA pseudouridine synthase [Rodentibacter trehalosifermentans]OOF52880.1 RNA pseudouridine synthase [Rodentibacter trehalosifermentans]
MQFDILYQHRDFIIIYKPCGISVHKDRETQGLTTQVANQLGVPQVWLIHRLDKITSGLLILALNVESASEFSRLFAEHQIHKTYLALSHQKPKKKQGLIIGDMKKARNGAWKLCQSKENPAITRFESVSCEPHLRLFFLRPQTGKTHQLRVAMKSLGSPILGDDLYGKNIAEIDRTYLHAARLEFEFYGEKFDVKAMPKEGKWWQKDSVKMKINENPFFGKGKIPV